MVSYKKQGNRANYYLITTKKENLFLIQFICDFRDVLGAAYSLCNNLFVDR